MVQAQSPPSPQLVTKQSLVALPPVGALFFGSSQFNPVTTAATAGANTTTLVGALAARSIAGYPNTGQIYVATDTHGGTPYYSTGGQWIQMAGSVTAALTDAANTFTVGPQTFQPDSDSHKGFVLKRHSSNAFGANLLEVQDEMGNIFSAINGQGWLGLAATPQTQFWIHCGSGANLAVTLVGSAVNISAADDTNANNAPLQVEGSTLQFMPNIPGGSISFFSATPVVQQANASQATLSAITDANARSVCQAFYNLLKNYGLAPATA